MHGPKPTVRVAALVGTLGILLVSCRGEAVAKDPAAAIVAAPTVPAATVAPAATVPALPQGFRACSADADCVVAPSLAGLNRLPRPGDACLGTCFVGVRKDALPAWLKAVGMLAESVPCAKEFEPCPPATHFRVACIRGTCVVSYVGQDVR